MTEIKICGLTREKEAEILRENKIEYAGIVLFYPKSHRNNSIENAEKIIKALGDEIKKVAVFVSPSLEQLILAEKLGFDYLQIHGELNKDVLEWGKLPIWRAFSVTKGMKTEEIKKIKDNIAGIVLDGEVPGAGKTFDWGEQRKFCQKGKTLILAGGLNEINVKKGIEMIKPDIVDVSSGVENENKRGKNAEKIRRFVKAVREDDKAKKLKNSR